MVEINKNSTNHSLNHAWNQSNINRIGHKFQIFKPQVKQNTKKKKKVQNGSNF